MESAPSTSTAGNRYCLYCRKTISPSNWTHHEARIGHLRKWAMHEGVMDYHGKTREELHNLYKRIKVGGMLDFGVFTTARLRQLAIDRRLEGATNIHDRSKLEDLLWASHEHEGRKLHLFNLQHLLDETRSRGLPTIGKTREQLISSIYADKNLHFCHPCQLAVRERRIHEASHEHLIKTGGSLEEFVEVGEGEERGSRTGKFRLAMFNNTSDAPLDIAPFLDRCRSRVVEFLTRSRVNMKIFMTLECEYIRDLVVSGPQLTNWSIHTKSEVLCTGDDLDDAVTSFFEGLTAREVQHQPNAGSGWSLFRVKRLIVYKAAHSPLSASSYIDLPKWVKDKHACINIQNKNDNLCFIYSVLCALEQPARDPQRPSKYSDRINHDIFLGFDYPMALKDISKFEAKTRKATNFPSLAVNVFEIGSGGRNTDGDDPDIAERCENGLVLKDDIRPVIISKANRSADKIVDLLLINNEKKQHYVVIKNLSRLVASQVTKHRGRLYFCRRCLSHFYDQRRLEAHQELCGEHAPCVSLMPERGSRLYFKNHINKFPTPFIIYADFETLGVPHEEQSGNNTVRIRKHVPYGFSIYLVTRVKKENQDQVEYERHSPIVFRAKTSRQLKRTPEIFVKKLHGIVGKKILPKYASPYPLIMTREDEEDFESAIDCHICGKPFVEDGEPKVRDHSRLEGGVSNYLGAAHQSCNLKRKLVTKIPVVLHNMSRFDAHLFVEPLFRHNDYSELTVVPSNEETYISLQKKLMPVPGTEGSADDDSYAGSEVDFEPEGGRKKKQPRYFRLRFIDSFRFLNSSIEKLANNLERDEFKHLNYFIEKRLGKYLRINKSRAFQILRGKGIFPYDFVDSLEKLNHNSLIGKEHFHNTLTDEGISDLDYYQYKLVWDRLKDKTLGFYSDLYNLQDVLLLADIFERFRDVCLQNYELDPAYYLTAPSLAWDAMLKKTNCEIALLSDPDMHLMVEKGIRGGIAQVCKRHVKANNKYLDDYDPSKPENYLMYMDACNLYGWALSQKLPCKHFQWVRHCPAQGGWEHFIANHDANSDWGYFLEVDIHYSRQLHDYHRDVPFAPDHRNKKLCTTLLPKSKYIVHIANLRQMLANGVTLKAVHRALKFRQEAFMKTYIDFNSEKRKNSQNEFEKNFYKLMVNSVFGRTMMNLRKQQKIVLCTEAQGQKLCKKPTFTRWTLFTDNFLACHLARNRIYFNQPIQVGCAVLELSKYLMYDFMYHKLKVWDPTTELVLMDTDSYLVEMRADPYEMIRRHVEYFDTSNYPEVDVGHPLYGIRRTENKNVPGKMKDELGGIPMSEVFGLRAKLYYYEYKGKAELRAKGVKRSVARKTIGKEEFRKALYEGGKHYVTQTNIRSSKHVVYTVQQTKLALSGNDDKRYIVENRIETYPWGHYAVPGQVAEDPEQDGLLARNPTVEAPGPSNITPPAGTIPGYGSTPTAIIEQVRSVKDGGYDWGLGPDGNSILDHIMMETEAGADYGLGSYGNALLEYMMVDSNSEPMVVVVDSDTED